MTIEQLVSAHRARPFRPFVIHMADGRSVGVTHPEFLARSPAGRTCVVYKPDESHEVIDLLLVSSLEVSANGQVGQQSSPDPDAGG